MKAEELLKEIGNHFKLRSKVQNLVNPNIQYLDLTNELQAVSIEVRNEDTKCSFGLTLLPSEGIGEAPDELFWTPEELIVRLKTIFQ